MNYKIFKVFFLAALYLITTYNISLAQQNEVKAKIVGKTSAQFGTEIRITNSPVFLGDDWHKVVDLNEHVIKTDKNGMFLTDLIVKKADFYHITLKGKTFDVFISPHDSIYLHIDSIVDFGGSNGHLNQFFLELSKHLNNNNLDNLYANMKGLFSAKLNVFTEKIDSLKLISYELYNKFISENSYVPVIFKERCTTDINCCYKYSKLLYPIVYENVNKESLNLDSNYINEIVNGSLNHPKLLNSLYYMKLLDRYIELKTAKDLDISNFYSVPREKIYSRYNVIKGLTLDNRIKNHLFEEHFKVCNINYSQKDWSGIFAEFENNCQNADLLESVRKKYTNAGKKREQPDEIKIFKEIDGIQLEAHIFYPKNYNKDMKYATYSFFHGGGWSIGKPEWGYEDCKRYSAKGMIAISFEYRLVDVHGTNIISCLEDTKSAIKWLRKYSNELGVDPNKIVAEGFSAGGHLVAALAVIKGFEENYVEKISSIPNAIIVQSGSYNFANNKWFSGMTNGKPESVSPYHHLEENMVPAILFHAKYDHLTKISEFKEFVAKMKSLNNNFEYYIFEDVGHFFRDQNTSKRVTKLKDDFLILKGFL